MIFARMMICHLYIPIKIKEVVEVEIPNPKFQTTFSNYCVWVCQIPTHTEHYTGYIQYNLQMKVQGVYNSRANGPCPNKLNHKTMKIKTETQNYKQYTMDSKNKWLKQSKKINGDGNDGAVMRNAIL